MAKTAKKPSVKRIMTTIDYGVYEGLLLMAKRRGHTIASIVRECTMIGYWREIEAEKIAMEGAKKIKKNRG